jgi:hypothetical protein
VQHGAVAAAARRSGWGRSSSAALEKAVTLLQSLSAAAGSGGGGGGAPGGAPARRASAHGIDLPTLPAQSAAGVAAAASGSLPAPLLDASKALGRLDEAVPAAAATAAAEAAAGGGGDEGSDDEGLSARLQVVGYLGYFNSLDEFDGYQPCGCLYPLFRRFAPQYWAFVTAKTQ